MRIPAVGNDPELDTILFSIAHDLDCMATLHGARLVLVNATSVGHEVLINCEGSFAWAVGAELSHHVCLARDNVGLAGLVLVLIPLLG